MEAMPIHLCPQYLQATIELLRTEWCMNQTKSLNLLQSSCDELPTSFIVVSDGEVVAFCTISKIRRQQGSGLIDLVVVREDKRGRGIGRFLMEYTEEYAKRHGMKALFLETDEMEAFYIKLGFTRCYDLGPDDSHVHTVAAITVDTEKTAPGNSASANDAACSSSAGVLTPKNPAHTSTQPLAFDPPALHRALPHKFILMKKNLA